MEQVLKREEIIIREAKGDTNGLTVLYSMGWGETPKVAQAFFDILTRQRKVISVFHPRRLKRKEIKRYKKKYFSRIQLEKALTLLEVLEKEGINETDAIGYSEGALVLAIAVNLKPKKFKRVIFVAPTGILGKVNPVLSYWLFCRNGRQGKTLTKKDKQRNRRYKLTSREFDNYVSKNKWLSIREAWEMRGQDLLEIVKKTKKDKNDFYFVCLKDDSLISCQKAKKRLAREGFDNFFEHEGCHTELKLSQKLRQFVANLLNSKN